MLQINFWCRIK